MCRWMLCVFCLLGMALWTQGAAALEIRSISPSSAEPGAAIAVTGGPFSPTADILFGGEVVPPESVEQTRILFRVPDLTEGDYLVLVREEEQVSPQGFIVRLMAPTPWISSLEPTRLEECSEDFERQITISGRGFAAGAQVLVNQAAVPSTSVSPERIIVTLPELKSGLHRIQIANPSGKQSLAHNVQISGIPEITSAVMGADQINYYELILMGRNFKFGSRLLVNGEMIRDLAGQRPGSEYVQVVDCRTLHYMRYPVTREPRSVTLQIINPDGAQSAPFSVTIP